MHVFMYEERDQKPQTENRRVMPPLTHACMECTHTESTDPR